MGQLFARTPLSVEDQVPKNDVQREGKEDTHHLPRTIKLRAKKNETEFVYKKEFRFVRPYFEDVHFKGKNKWVKRSINTILSDEYQIPKHVVVWIKQQ